MVNDIIHFIDINLKIKLINIEKINNDLFEINGYLITNDKSDNYLIYNDDNLFNYKLNLKQLKNHKVLQNCSNDSYFIYDFVKIDNIQYSIKKITIDNYYFTLKNDLFVKKKLSFIKSKEFMQKHFKINKLKEYYDK